MMPVSGASRNTNKETSMKSVLLILGLSSLLMACSPGDPDPKIAEDQREVMDKAQGVEDVLQQSADQTRQQVDEQAQ
jgi:hypothetical protein